ncbi:MAG TPA: glycosyltransferase family 2 protein, partial [Bryobacteraceae bacterium]|nr:glycosyltransferase family 2 protein [Bryobacteraceae bacterium]
MLENLRQQTLAPAEIVVVDNGSVDETADVAARFGLQRIAFDRNLGFATAVNAGISAAKHEWILILNNDVELQPDWLERALESVKEQDAQFVAGKILQGHAPGRLDGTWDLVT